MSYLKDQVIFIVLMLVWSVPPLAHAEVAIDLKDDSQWSISIGGFWAATGTTVRIDSSDGSPGSTISGEDDLDWDERAFSPFVALNYRFNKNHFLLLSFWSLRRDGVRDIAVDLNIGDTTYTLGSTLDSEFITDIYRLTYGYNFYQTEQTTFAFLLGLHVTNLKFDIRAVGNSGTTYQGAADAIAPLPTLGLSASYKLNQDWYLSGWIQGMALEYLEYDGKMLNGSFAITYKPFKYLGFSAGGTVFDFNLNSSDADALGEFDYEYAGPFVAIQTAF